MKTLSITLFLTLISLISFAQENKANQQHLTFKGIAIDGRLNDFVAKLKTNGFTFLGTEEGITMLQGDFASYKNCLVAVSTLKQKDLVSKISVIFQEKKNWASLSNNYFSLKELLIEKYGEPSAVVEEFQTRMQPNDDQMKMLYVNTDQCKYYTFFETEKGDIELSITKTGSDGCVILRYFDKINGETISNEAIKDL